MSESEPKSSAFVILGATGSVGSALARRLAATGGKLMLAGRDQNRLEELSTELSATSHQIDAAQPESIEAAIEAAREQFGTINGVVNCIGSVLLKPAHSTSLAEWDETIATNLTSAFATMRAAGAAMRKTGGSVVLVSSAAARIGLANHEAIAAAKAGVAGLTLSAAATYASRGIRVNAVAPGLLKSRMTKRLWESEAAAEASKAMHPLGRLGEPDEVAGLIAWLLDPANSWDAGILGLPEHTGQDRVSLAEARETIVDALCAADEERFRRTALDLYLNGHDVCTICNEVLTPVLTEIGSMWHDGTLEVFEEHRSCEFCIRLLHEFRTLLPDPGRAAPLMIGTTLDSDPYTLPREMVELIFREAGWQAVLIGHRLSIENLQAAIEHTRPGLCCLSLSQLSDPEAFPKAYAPFAEAMRRRRLPVIAGGRALTPNLREQMPFTLFGDNFEQLRVLADSLRPDPQAA
eukprot:g8345.t1